MIFLLAVVVSLFYPSSLPLVQEGKLSAEELLRFFPLDSYEGVYHEQTAELRAGVSYKTFEEFSSNYFEQGYYIPPILRESADSLTVASRLKFVLYVDNDEISNDRPTKSGVVTVGEKKVAIAHIRRVYWVLRTPDAYLAIDRMLESGKISKANYTVRDHPVYGYTNKSFVRTSDTAYFCAISPREILGAAEIADIRRMAAVETGEIASIQEYPPIEYFKMTLPYAGQALQWHNQIPHEAVQLWREPKDRDEEETMAAAMEKIKGTFPTLNSLNAACAVANSYDVTDDMIFRKIGSYQDDDIAAEALDAMKQNSQKLATEGMVGDPHEHIRDGRLVISTLTYDEAMIEKLRQRQQGDKKKQQAEEQPRVKIK